MSSGRVKNTNPFLILKYPGFSFILNGAFIKEVMIDAPVISIPNLRFPFSCITVRDKRVFPVIGLDECISARDRDFFPFYLFITTAKCGFCINTSRMPVMFYDYFRIEKTHTLKCFDLYKKDEESYIDIIPDELYTATQDNFARLLKAVDGGTGI